MTTIKEVREALDELARRQQSDTNIAAAMYTSGLIHRLDSMVLVPKARLVTALAAVGTDMISDDEWQARCELLNAAEDK